MENTSDHAESQSVEKTNNKQNVRWSNHKPCLKVNQAKIYDVELKKIKFKHCLKVKLMSNKEIYIKRVLCRTSLSYMFRIWA